MPLLGRVVAAPPGVHGFDADSVLNRGLCEVAKARGFEFCIRYVSRQDVQPTGDRSEAEANVILSAGLALMSVQHVAPNVNVWLDLEGATTSTPHDTIIAYCNAWLGAHRGQASWRS
jgi:hypothetical protein